VHQLVNKYNFVNLEGWEVKTWRGRLWHIIKYRSGNRLDMPTSNRDKRK
jgi:hypothetical protein